MSDPDLELASRREIYQRIADTPGVTFVRSSTSSRARAPRPRRGAAAQAAFHAGRRRTRGLSGCRVRRADAPERVAPGIQRRILAIVSLTSRFRRPYEERVDSCITVAGVSSPRPTSSRLRDGRRDDYEVAIPIASSTSTRFTGARSRTKSSTVSSASGTALIRVAFDGIPRSTI